MQTSLWADNQYNEAVATPLHMPESSWVPPRMEDLPTWGDSRVSLDIETRDESIRKLGPGARRDNCYMIGVAFAIEGGSSFYLPTRHNGGNMDEAQVIKYLMEQAHTFTGILVGANIAYDLDFLAEYGVKFTPKFFRDVQIAEPLLDENQFQYNLEAIAGRWGLMGKDETLLKNAAYHMGINPKSEMYKLHSKYVGAYAQRDCMLPLELIRKQERELENQELWDVYNMESELLIANLRMTRRGIRIDLKQLEYVESVCHAEEKIALKQLSGLTGIKFGPNDVNKGTSLARALDHIGASYPLTPKTRKPSINAELLKSLDHPVADHILTARKYNKLYGTFVRSIRAHMVNGRLHPGFHQMRAENASGEDKGARFGRMSSSHPNIQQQPSKGALGKMWRGIYLPDEGGVWSCNDYSQQEPRWAVNFGELKKYKGAKRLGDMFRDNPKMDCYDLMTNLVPIERKAAKDVYLGRSYRMGDGKTCKKLGYPTVLRTTRAGHAYEAAGPEGAAIIKKFDSEMPFVKLLSDEAERLAETRGYIRTASGRKCRFPVDANGDVPWAYKALNRLIQGSAADQTKMATVAADKAGFKTQIQVHDELDLTVENRAHAEKLAQVMCDCVTITVPTKVDVEIGPNWGDISSET